MTEVQMLWAWLRARVNLLGEPDREDGFTTLEWVAIAGVVIVAAIVIATILMNTAKTGAQNVKVQ